MAVISIKNKTKSGSLLVGNEAFFPTDYESIATVTVGSTSQSSITFSSIPSTYKHLQIRFLAKTDRATYAHDDFGIKLGNGSLDSGSNYSCHKIQSEYVSGYTNVYASGAANTTMYFIGSAISTAGNGAFGVGIIDILDYADTNKYKTVRAISGGDCNGAVSGYLPNIVFGSGSWRNTSSVNTISIYPSGGGSNFVQYSSFALYGIKG